MEMNMKKYFIIAFALLLAGNAANAQSFLEKLGQKALDKAVSRTESAADRAVDKAFDAVEGLFSKKDKKEAGQEAPADNQQTQSAPAAGGWTCPECGKTGNTGKFCADCGAKKPGAETAAAADSWTCPECGKTGNTGNFCDDCGAKKPGAGSAVAPAPKKVETSYAKSDFVPGDEIIFDDDFADEQLGEFPSKWDLDGGEAEVAMVDGRKVLMTGNRITVFPLMKNPKNYLPDVFTVEWDMYFGGEDDPRTKVELGLMTDEQGVNSHNHFAAWLEIIDWFGWHCRKPIEDQVTGSKYFSEIGDAVKYNDWNHIAVSFNKRAFKAYLNGVRVCNVPNMLAPKYLQFYIEGDTDNNYKAISNVRIAKGAVPLYDRLATDGKIITYAITFDTGKATLKPEADVEINRIKGLLDQDPGLKFEVQGHCDSTGSATTNDKLSQQRAEAIVARLEELGIAKGRLTAVGKGSHEPIADNSTDEGRAKNRRVEFVKK